MEYLSEARAEKYRCSIFYFPAIIPSKIEKVPMERNPKMARNGVFA
jgi:hypothetical protein